MELRRFGRTGLQISSFTLGGGIVGGILILPPEEVRLEAVERALAAGCNWIDTAASYGNGESERTLGHLLPHLARTPYVSTKVRIDTAALHDLEGQVRASVEASLSRLRTRHVDLLQLHNPIGRETGSGMLSSREILRTGGVADVFDRLREEGYFHWHGITALGEAPVITDVLRSGRFDTAQVYFNMLNPSAARTMPRGWTGQDFGGVVDACREQDVGIMNIRVLAAGVLATDRRHGREVVIARDAELAHEQGRARGIFGRLGPEHGTRAQTAIRWALAHPDTSTIVVGTASLAELDEALEAFDRGPLPASALAAIEPCYAEGLSSTIGSRS